MALWLKQSTAVEVKVGPFVDATDGVTAETALTITSAEVLLAKGPADWAAKTEATSLVHESNGWYRCLLDTTDTGTLGHLMLQIAESGALPVWHEYIILPAVIYDSLVLGTDLLDVSVTQWLGTAAATPTVAGVPEVDITHIAGSAVSTSSAQLGVNAVSTTAGAITSASFAAGAINAAAIAADAIGASELAADAITEIQAGLATAAALATVQADTDDIQTRIPATLVAGRIDASVGAMAAGTVTAAAIATDAIDADALAADAVTEIWAKAMTELTTVPGVTGTVLQALSHVFHRLSQRRTETATVETIYQADGSTVYATSAKSDDDTTFVSGADTTA